MDYRATSFKQELERIFTKQETDFAEEKQHWCSWKMVQREDVWTEKEKESGKITHVWSKYEWGSSIARIGEFVTEKRM